MSVLNQIAHLQGRRDEVPNQELAKVLAGARNRAGIREIATNLWNPDRNIQADCIKVLYEIGYLDPELIAPYTDDFLELLGSRNNRMVWGGMIALATVAAIEAKRIYAQRALVVKTIDVGSTITVDAGVKVLAAVAAQSAAYRKTLFPLLLEHLRTRRAKDIPQHAESAVIAVNSTNKREFIETLERRMPGMPSSRLARIKRVIRAAERK